MGIFDKNSPLKKKDKILFIVSISLLVCTLALFIISITFFIKSNGDADHTRFLTACILLFIGGVLAMGASVCLLLTPLMQTKRKRLCPYCGAATADNTSFCSSCGKLLKTNVDSVEETAPAEERTEEHAKEI